MNRTRLWLIAFSLWSALTVLGFVAAGREGYALFATAGKPTPHRPEPGENHK